jgi:hypothetical protein
MLLLGALLLFVAGAVLDPFVHIATGVVPDPLHGAEANAVGARAGGAGGPSRLRDLQAVAHAGACCAVVDGDDGRRREGGVARGDIGSTSPGADAVAASTPGTAARLTAHSAAISLTQSNIIARMP